VVGATGRTGVPLVEEALERGHTVRALARDVEKARRVLPAHADVVVGDGRDGDALRRLVDDVDVVLDVSGPVKGEAPGFRTASTRALLDALADRPEVGVVHLTGAGVRRAGDQPGVPDRLARGLMRLVARRLLEDSTDAVDALEVSGRRALVVRAPRLTDGEATGRHRVAPAVGKGSGLQVTRADLARALLDLAESDAWPGGSPVVSA